MAVMALVGCAGAAESSTSEGESPAEQLGVSQEALSLGTTTASTIPSLTTSGPVIQIPCWMRDPASCVPDGTRLLIVGPSQFSTDMERLRQHKNATGMPAWVLSMDDIRKYDGRDDAERLKKVIARLHEQKGTWYVLLAGDASVVPVRRRRVLAAGQNESFNPSDLYYANLYHHVGSRAGTFDDWDTNGNGLFNEEFWEFNSGPYVLNPDDVDGYPDIAVGRVPAHDTQGFGRYVDKIIRYETGQTVTSPLTRAAFVADKNYPGATSLLGQLESRTFLANASVGHYEGNTFGPGLDPGWATADFSLLDGLTYTMPWIAYVGHGYSTGWGLYDIFTNNALYDAGHVRTLRNTNLPVVFAAACETGKFAENIMHEPPTGIAPGVYDAGGDLSMGGAWLFGSESLGGAIAYFGETVVLPNNWAVDLETAMLNAYGSGYRVLGDLWASGARSYWSAHQRDKDVFSNPRIYLGIMEMMGDPSLRLF
ncbi:Chitinase [Labilithrix luteola]|uniref:Chitinase n=2 Tax=Labilithrix luteola TaxID=1391654 RepID=A0A0K1PP76_9BACT|nr:Chitinase [Labilithrix luteola]